MADDRRGGGRRFFRYRRPRRKICMFCQKKIDSVDYKDVALLTRFVSDRGKVLPRRVTGNCAQHQRVVARAIKRAREVALLPFVSE